MNHLAQLKDFYSKFNILNGNDKRNQQQILKNHEFVKNLTLKNLSALQIKLTNKQGKNYKVSKLKRIELGDGIYCNLTDNQINSEQTIMTLHGAPGNYIEWAGLENQIKGKYRWINIMIPGFDGQDERRGLYDGTKEGFSNMLLRIVAKLKLKRIIICGHSFGTTIGFTLVQSFPQIIEGFINIAGLNSIWTLGMGFMYKSCIVDIGYYKQSWKQGKPYDKNELRQQIYQKYVDNYKKKRYQQAKIPLLSYHEYFGFLKLSFGQPQQFSNMFRQFKQSSVLRVLIYGNKDFIVPCQNSQYTIYSLINDHQSSYLYQPKAQKIFKSMKNHLQNKLKEKLGITIQGDKIQQYFCVIFDETGHNIHRRRPQELSRIIQVFLISLQVIYQNKVMFKSSL